MSDRHLGPILARPEIILGWIVLAIVVCAPYWAAFSYPNATLTVGKIALCCLMLCSPVWATGFLRKR
jgi:hypothetical protein